MYLSAEQWVNSYINAIIERQFDVFRNRYRNGCDILLIDDIQFLASKDASQDEFLHTFNCLHEAKKQIVVTSDKYPLGLTQAKEILAPVIKKRTVVVSWQKVCETVATYYDLRSADLVGKSRQRQVAFARQMAMCICRSMLQMSLPEIGRVFGGRDHSTVLSSLRKIEEHKRLDVSLQSVLQKLESKVASMANS